MNLSARHVLEFCIYDIVYRAISRLVRRLDQTLRWVVFYLAALSLYSSHRLGFFVLLYKLGYVLFASGDTVCGRDMSSAESRRMLPALQDCSPSSMNRNRVSNSPKRNKSFKFFNYCSNYPNFHKIIVDA
ncbi:hypothetical protein C4D60_Mb04t19880 [Musa balbisiana]|uniref:Uncharacterized protein n=1 Tax=Musa balbisiana TaxID=52838 RepID=A0A4S8KDA8_MUSBA|nr:hypothetical protein C4D60_Mb04t19880 [Musa balbisiana]